MFLTKLGLLYSFFLYTSHGAQQAWLISVLFRPRCVLSVCLWTPRLSLGHPGSFKSVLDLLACVHRLDLGFTSHPKDARHSNE